MQAALSNSPYAYCPDIREGDWLITSVDSCVSGRAGGRVSDAELAKLDATVAATDASHVAVFMHHPPVLMGSAWLDTVGLENRDAFMAAIAKQPKLRYVFFGHVHQEYDREHGSVRIIATPSTCRQFKPKSATFDVDDNPPAYRRIELLANGDLNTELVWVSND